MLRRAGRQLLRSTKQAQLIIEDGESEVYASFDAAREYMSANVDWILRQYGERHQVGKTDIMIVSSLTSPMPANSLRLSEVSAPGIGPSLSLDSLKISVSTSMSTSIPSLVRNGATGRCTTSSRFTTPLPVTLHPPLPRAKERKGRLTRPLRSPSGAVNSRESLSAGISESLPMMPTALRLPLQTEASCFACLPQVPEWL